MAQRTRRSIALPSSYSCISMQQPSPHGTPQEWQQQHNDDLQPSDCSSPAAAAAAPRQQPTNDAEPADTAVLIDSSNEEPRQAAARRQQYTKQVSFPPDDNLATVHQLRPSSSAGDLAPWNGDAAAAGEQEGDNRMHCLRQHCRGRHDASTHAALPHWQQQMHALTASGWQLHTHKHITMQRGQGLTDKTGGEQTTDAC